LTGGPPLRACTPAETLRRLAEDEPVPPSRLRDGVPADLSAVCLKCLEKDPRNRYPSAAALAQDLRRFLDGEPTQARPAGPGRRAWKWARRRPAIAGLLALVVLLALGGAGGVVGALIHAVAGWDKARSNEQDALKARDDARQARNASQRQI